VSPGRFFANNLTLASVIPEPPASPDIYLGKDAGGWDGAFAATAGFATPKIHTSMRRLSWRFRRLSSPKCLPIDSYCS
jgi:chromate transport protein ChrA